MFFEKLTVSPASFNDVTNSNDVTSPQFLKKKKNLLAGCHGQDKSEPHSVKSPSSLSPDRPCDNREGWSHPRPGRTL